jgi:hypothetical protein
MSASLPAQSEVNMLSIICLLIYVGAIAVLMGVALNDARKPRNG